MVDAEHSKCFARKGVWVRVPLSAPKQRDARHTPCISFWFWGLSVATVPDYYLIERVAHAMHLQRVRGTRDSRWSSRYNHDFIADLAKAFAKNDFVNLVHQYHNFIFTVDDTTLTVFLLDENDLENENEKETKWTFTLNSN